MKKKYFQGLLAVLMSLILLCSPLTVFAESMNEGDGVLPKSAVELPEDEAEFPEDVIDPTEVIVELPDEDGTADFGGETELLDNDDLVPEGDYSKSALGEIGVQESLGGSSESFPGIDEELGAEPASMGTTRGGTRGVTGVYDNLTYTIENGEVTITGSTLEDMSEVNLIIPDTIEGYPVTTIGSTAFEQKQLSNVTLPKFLTHIEDAAFFHNQIRSVTIPNSVTTIGKYAFHRNQLTSLTLPDSVIEVGIEAFSYNKITEIVFPKSITTIWQSAFSTNELSGITIPDTVTMIEDFAFDGNNLTDVTIPDSVTTIGYSAFGYNQLTSVTIPNSVTTIGYGAFQRNQLTSVTIPDSVTSIGERAFEYNQLSSVTLGNSVALIGERAFRENELSNIIIPDSVTSIGESAFAYNQLTSVTLGNSVKTIGGYAFHRNKLKSVIIPNSVKQIGKCAFISNLLSSVTLGESLQVIGEFAFAVNELSSVTIPDSVYYISRNPFGSISNITFSGDFYNRYDYYNSDYSIRAIVDGFWYTDEACSNIFDTNTRSIPKGTYYINQNEYYTYDDILFVIKDDHVEVVEYRGTSESVTIPDLIENLPVTTIQPHAFQEKNLLQVRLPNFLTTIGRSAFADNSDLEHITIPASVRRIDQGAFGGCFKEEGMSISFLGDFENETQPIYDTCPENMPLPVGHWIDDNNRKKDLNAAVIPAGTYRREISERDYRKHEYSFMNHERYFSHGNRISDVLLLAQLQVYASITEGHIGNYCLITRLIEKWGGSCFGMSFFQTLVMNGLENPMSWEGSNSNVNSLPSPNDSDDSESIINFYQMTQFLSFWKRDSKRFKLSKDEKSIPELIDACGNTSLSHPIIITFKYYCKKSPLLKAQSDGGHVLVAIEHYQDSFSFEGKTYSDKIVIMDPNFGLSNLYLNREPSAIRWAHDRDWKCRFDFSDEGFSADEYALPLHAYSNIRNYKPLSYKSLDAGFEENTNIAPQLYLNTDINTNHQYIISSSLGSYSLSDIFSDSSPYAYDFIFGRALDSDIPATAIIELPLEDTVTITNSNSSSAADYYFLGTDYSFDIKADRHSSVTFDPNGKLSFQGDGANVEAALVTEAHTKVLDKFQLEITANNINELTLQVDPENGGVIIEGDNLQNIQVTNTDLENSVSVVFSTKESRALVKSPSPEEVVVYVDQDQNGSFNTLLVGPKDNLTDPPEAGSGGEGEGPEGSGQIRMVEQTTVWYQDTGGVATFKSNAEYEDFERVEIDEEEIDPQHYDVNEGSTLVTLKESFLRTLSTGKHSVAIVSTTGTARGEFEIKAMAAREPADENKPVASAPKTGESRGVARWLGMLFLSAASGLFFISRKKRTSKQEE